MQLSPTESLADVTRESQRFEEEIFLDAIRDFYEREFDAHEDLFDYAAARTNNFRDFSQSVIRDNPSVVKVLRYLVKPPISQMKFGQFAGVNSTDSTRSTTTSRNRLTTTNPLTTCWMKFPWT